MAIQIKITDFDGSMKKIAGSNVFMTMGPDAIWYDSNASSISINDTLSIASKDFIINFNGTYVSLEFTPDSSGSNGQGLSVPAGILSASVISVTGTCYVLRSQHCTLATEKTDAYTDINKISATADMILYPNDMIVCEKSSSKFEIKTTFDIENASPGYATIALVQLCQEAA